MEAIAGFVPLGPSRVRIGFLRVLPLRISKTHFFFEDLGLARIEQLTSCSHVPLFPVTRFCDHLVRDDLVLSLNRSLTPLLGRPPFRLFHAVGRGPGD